MKAFATVLLLVASACYVHGLTDALNAARASLNAARSSADRGLRSMQIANNLKQTISNGGRIVTDTLSSDDQQDLVGNTISTTLDLSDSVSFSSPYQFPNTFDFLNNPEARAQQIVGQILISKDAEQVQAIVYGLLSDNPPPQLLQAFIVALLTNSELPRDFVQAATDALRSAPEGTQAEEIISSVLPAAQEALSSVTNAAAQDTDIAGNLVTDENIQDFLKNLGTAGTQAPGVLSNLVGTATNGAQTGIVELIGGPEDQTDLGSLFRTSNQAASNVVRRAPDTIIGLRNPIKFGAFGTFG